MAKLENLQQALTKNQLSPGSDLGALVKRVDVVKRFEEVLGKKTPGFVASLLSMVNGTPALQRCEPKSILASAMIAATLDLPINPNLGFAAIVPYRNNKTGETVAQFQMMVKGFVQLAIRTGQYESINAAEVYEGELIEWNRVAGRFTIDESKKKSDKIIGWVAHFRLLSGFEKYLYMTVEQIHRHAKKYSKTYDNPNGSWTKNKEAMESKTPLKLMLSKWGILSVEMNSQGKFDNALEKAIQYDQAVVVEGSSGEAVPTFPDNPANDMPNDAQEPFEPGDLPLK